MKINYEDLKLLLNVITVVAGCLGEVMGYIIVALIAIVIVIELIRGDYARPFFPDEYLDGTYVIDFEKLYQEGKRGVIFDIDNTLVMHNYPADDRAKLLMKRLEEIGYKIVFLSNNKEPRVKQFRDDALKSAQYIYKAGKPKRSGYIKACNIMGTDISNTLFVGDQLFTDVWGAKRSGICNILVKPIDKKEEIQIVLKRKLEAIVLFYYKRSKQFDCSSHKK